MVGRIFMLILCVLLIGQGAEAIGTEKFKDELVKESEAVKLLRDATAGGYQVLTTEELQQAIKAGEDIVIVDTMPYEDSFKKGHIPKAKSFLFPIAAMNEWDGKETGGKTPQDYEKLLGPDKNKKVVVYCGFVKCTRSHNGAVWAKKLGYNNVYRHPGGIFAWRGAEYEVETLE